MNQKPITTFSSPWAWVRRVLHERTILVLSILFLTGIVLLLWDLERLSSELNQKAALESAAQSVNTLREFRTLYTSEVVAVFGLRVLKSFMITSRNQGPFRFPPPSA